MPAKVGVGCLIIVAAVAMLWMILSVWRLEGAVGSCWVVRGMSRDAVVRECGRPDGLEWRPPDYRHPWPPYWLEYLDIDYAGCPGAALLYGKQLVVFKWEGGVATVAVAENPADGEWVNAGALTGCGPREVARQIESAGLAPEAQYSLAKLSAEGSPAARQAASECMGLLEHR